MKTITLVAATVTTGLMAGLFSCFAYAIMPALHKTDDRSFVTVMNHINKVILNGWFMTAFMGALLFGIAATVLHWKGDARNWVIAGLVLYALMFLITTGINVPMNDKLALATDPATYAAARETFESRWMFWNIVRAVTATSAFAVLSWALIIYGRSQP